MILQIISDEKFTPEYIDLIEKYFYKEDHVFIILSYGRNIKYVDETKDNLIFIHKSPHSTLKMASLMKKADKIIFHGLFSRITMTTLFLTGSSRKTYACLWGGDLYVHDRERKIIHLIKRHILKNCRGIAMELEEDYQLAQQWYGTESRYFHCLLYMSNVVRKKHEHHEHIGNTHNIMIGNSATVSNRHLEVLYAIQRYASEDITINIPLSYGDTRYADMVENEANKMFPGKVRALRKFMPIEEYLEFLDTIDVAVFAHKRQQGLGNIISLISMGKKVYIPSEVTVYKAMIRNGINVYPTEDITDTILEKMDKNAMITNINNAYQIFSKEELIEDWRRIFDD